MSFTCDLQLESKIDSGFFGDVFSGVDNIHGKVAVKVLRQSPMENVAQWGIRKETLLFEAKKLKAAEHENIVRVHALVRAVTSDQLHMVTEFCDQGSLNSEYFKGPMSLRRAKTVLTDVCRGLEFMHLRGMVHRDIKPGNILGANGRLKVGDFGLVSDDLTLGYASAAGYSDHIAPEVYKAHLTSAQSDVWALGMTTYRLLHGHSFYKEHFGFIDIPDSIKNGSFSSRLPWLPSIPNGWQRFIRKAMHDNTANRFKTAFSMCQAASALPVEPVWECEYSADKIVWQRAKGARLIKVTWEKVFPRKYRWRAVSHGGLRAKLLAETKQPVSRSEARSRLAAFFAQSFI